MRRASILQVGLRALSVLLACALFPRGALGNDATFGGSGADLVPLVQPEVQMKSEDVVLTARGFEWLVQADYVFYNPGAAAKVQVGFPEYRCEPEGDCSNVAFRDLETTIDGVRVQHRQGQLEKGHGWADFLGVVWLFDVAFPAGKEVRIRHRYRLYTGADVEGNHYTSYVTRTGRSWAGPIGRAKFTAIFPPYTRLVRDPQVKGLVATAPRLILDGAPRVELVLSGKDWTPEGGLSFSYNASAQLSLEPIDVAKAAAAGQLPIAGFCNPGQDVEEAQRCLNELYAAKGYPFKNAAIAKRYYSGDPAFRALELGGERLWVRDASPLHAFSPAWFLRPESDLIKQWSDFIAQERAAAGGSSQAAEEAAAATRELPPPAAPTQPVAALPAAGTSPTQPSSPALERANRSEPVAAPAAPTPSPAPSGAAREAAPNQASPAARCGCRFAGHDAPRAAGWLAVLAGLAVARRRRAPRSR